jgi:hypothetical protein
MASDNTNSGKGVSSSTVRPTSSLLTNAAPEHLPSDTRNVTVGNPLELFQWLVSIHTPPCIALASGSSTRSDNVGLYQRSKHQERRSEIAYLLTSYISNTLFLLQTMLAAAFTGLSAYEEASPVTLTILGAFNTVVAG